MKCNMHSTPNSAAVSPAEVRHLKDVPPVFSADDCNIVTILTLNSASEKTVHSC